MRIKAFAPDNPNIWRKEFTCTGVGWHQSNKPCGCLLEIEATDIRKRTHKDISGETDIYYGFVCCNCGCFTEIPSTVLPSSVKNMATKYTQGDVVI